ncbi:MAG: dihydroneopterin aldolase [Muribaculum sp.]|nr:dihydroneopterin aldolase [Muribaculum sp.]
MKTTIEVNGLKLQGYHGVYEQERRVGNTFVIDIHLTVEIDSQILAEDNIGSTISYADIVGIAKEQMSVPSALLEHVAWRIHESLTNRYPELCNGMIRVAKLTPPLGDELSSAAVRIEW